MTPSLTETQQLLADLDRWQDRYNRHAAHLTRAIAYYDDCPDGDPRKPGAVKSMNDISDSKRHAETQISKIIDRLDELGHQW